jgi:hypothetical protein
MLLIPIVAACSAGGGGSGGGGSSDHGELNSGSYEASEFNYVDPYPPGFPPVLRLNSIRPN